MSDNNPAGQHPWGGPPQDPYAGAPQYPHDPGAPGGFPPPPPTTAFPPPGGGFPPPADPYAPGGGGYPPPGGGFPPPPPPGGGYPGGGFPAGPPQRSGGGAGKIILVIAGVVLLALCLGGGYTAYRLTSGNDDDKPRAEPSATASAAPSGTASGSARPSNTRSSSASAPTGGSNPDTFVKGDCFVNDGTDSSPKLRKVTCTTSGAYQVVAKVAFTTDKERCNDPVLGAGEGKFDAWYTVDKNPGTVGDYVLCLKRR